MDALIDEISQDKAATTLRHLKNNILDCAKNIKSNDATFKISTLPEVMDKLKLVMDNYITQTRQIKAHETAFMKLREELDKREEEAEIDELIPNESEGYRNLYEQLIETASASFANLEKNAMSDLNKIICPSLNEEEIQFETPSSRRIPIDPITRTNIKVAVKSTVCNHVYDRDGIEDYFKQKELAKKTNKIQCPQAGCTNKRMTRGELVLDEETNELIKSLTTGNNE